MLPITKIIQIRDVVVGSLPDIDTDFSADNRHKIFDYLRGKYKHIARVCNFTYLKAKSGCKDIGKAFGFEPGTLQQLSDLMDMEQPLSFSLAKQETQEFVRNNEMIHVIRTLQQLEGTVRNYGVHAAAIVISPDDLSDLVPLNFNKDNPELLVAGFDMRGCEEVGLIKYDLLGLASIDAVYNSAEMAGVDVTQIPLDDQKVYDFMASGVDTYGIFQFEKSMTREIIKVSKPKSILDLAAITAAIRPGALHSGFHIEYIKGHKEHHLPIVNEVLAETNGIMLYQEQLMELAQRMAGLTEIQADDLRQGIGKKKKALIEKYRSIFIEGATAAGYHQRDCEDIYTWFEESAAYAFNKAHSVQYSIISYYCAWMRYYHPAEFFAAFLNSYISDRKKLVWSIKRCKRIGIEFVKPDINTSAAGFTVVDGKLQFGFTCIKGVGPKVSDNILKKRKGTWRTVEEFISSKVSDVKSAEALANAGCFDNIVSSREKAIDLIRRKQTQTSMFAEDQAEHVQSETRIDKGKMERELLGIHLSKNPLEDMSVFNNGRHMILSDLEPHQIGKMVNVCCVITSHEKKLSRGKPPKEYRRVTLSDPYIDMTGMCFEKAIPGAAPYIDKLNQPVLITGWLGLDTFQNEVDADFDERNVDQSDLFSMGKITILKIVPLNDLTMMKTQLEIPDNISQESMTKLKELLDSVVQEDGDELHLLFRGKRMRCPNRVVLNDALKLILFEKYGIRMTRFGDDSN